MAEQFAASDRPTGTVTILFTDIEGSTRLLLSLGVEEYSRLLGEHHRLVRESVLACRGIEIKTEGDSFFVVFPSAIDALTAAADVQRSLAAQEWPQSAAVAVRMGVHTGEVQVSGGEYVGIDVHRAARISAAAHGGQVLLSEPTRALAAANLPTGVALRDLGEHVLKDIDQPEHLFQLDVDGLRTEFPPVRAASTRFDLLPAQLTSFVGREKELDGARELLAITRLLTLTGPGGTGKTRLALQLARAVADDYGDGVAFVQLAAITEPSLVPSTIRIALGVPEQQGQAAMGTLIERLRDRHVLLVLDNFEQVLDAATVVAELLEALPALTVIVTSRVALRITGEQEFAVPPLSVPQGEDATDLQRLGQSDAVTLFVQRARAVRPDFQVTPDNGRAVAEICARVDGLPLAIELAASRIKLLPPAALLERLANRLDFLQTSAADRTDRQRTLRGAIDWSYNLLPESQRAVFRRLSIFVGGWRLEEAEQVGEAAGRLDQDVFEGIAVLVDHSLVRRLDEETDLRFGMLETIREFGLEQLDLAGEMAATAAMHANRFAALAAEAEPKLTQGPEWLDRLERDHDNIRASLRWLRANDIQSGLAMCGQLWRFWHLRGHLREGVTTASAILNDPAAAPRIFARAKALIGVAGLVYWRLEYALARTYYEEALSIAREVGDPTLEVETLYSLAYVRDIEGDSQGAERDFRDAKALYEAQGNELMATWALESLGMAATIDGRHEEAVPILEDSIARFRNLGDTFGERNALSVLSRALMHLDRLGEARALNRSVLRLASGQRDFTSVSASLLDASSLFALDGDLERAAVVIGAAYKVMEESGGQPPPELVNRIDAMPALERSLGAPRLAALIAEGRLLTVDQATELALRD